MYAFGLQNVNGPGHGRRTGRDEYRELSVGMPLDDEGRHERFLDLHQRGLERLLVLFSRELSDHTAYDRKTGESTKQMLLEPVTDALAEFCANQQTNGKTNQNQQAQSHYVMVD